MLQTPQSTKKNEQTLPVVDYYTSIGKMRTVQAEKEVEELGRKAAAKAKLLEQYSEKAERIKGELEMAEKENEEAKH